MHQGTLDQVFKIELGDHNFIMGIQTIINGITVGSIYALIAIGYSIVFSILRVINFAHGSFYMIGAVAALTIYNLQSVPFWLALLVGLLIASIAGLFVEKIAIMPLRKKGAPRRAFLLSTLGMQIFLDNMTRIIWGARTKPFVAPIGNISYNFLNARITRYEIIILIITFVLLISLEVFLKKVKTGKAIRATAQNPIAAGLMGIEVDNIVTITFIIAALLGGVAGILVGIYYNTVYATMGFVAGLKGFSAAILGGMGSLTGAMLGGFILGIAENLGSTFFGAGMRDIIAFSIIILVLILKPNGLMGLNIREKV